MTRSLLDINVLIALVDPDHIAHEPTHEWAATGLADGWASCAITENGFVRILSQPAYPADLTVAGAIDLLRRMRKQGSHAFWGCTQSLTEMVDSRETLGPRHITDAYLLAMAVAEGGRFVTLDRSIPLRAVPGAGPEHLVVL